MINGKPVVGNAGATDFAQCSPLIGVKFGAAMRFQSDWEVAGAIGLAISLVNSDTKVREHELFADVEVNKYLRRAFVGAGMSAWDMSRSDTFTPAWLAHVGVPLTHSPTRPVFLLIEGRGFLDHASDIPNNYLVWGGVRIHL